MTAWPTVAAVLFAAVLAAACSDDTALDPGPPSPARVTQTGSAAAGAEKPVVTLGPGARQHTAHPAVAAFRAYQDAYSTALFMQDPNHQPLLETTAGRMREAAQQRIRQLADKGWVMRGATLWSILAVREESGTRAVLEGCHWYSSSYAVDPATGAPAEELRDEWVAADIELARTGDRWQVQAVVPASFPCTEAVQP